MTPEIWKQIFNFFKTPSLNNEEEFIQKLLEISSFHLVADCQNLRQITADLIKKTINNEQLLSWETKNISFYKPLSKRFELKEKYQIILVAWFEEPEEQSKNIDNIDIKFYDEFVFEIKQVTNSSIELSEFCYTLLRKIQEFLVNRFSRTLLCLNSCKIAIILIAIDDLIEYFTFIPCPLVKSINKNPYSFKEDVSNVNIKFVNQFYKKGFFKKSLKNLSFYGFCFHEICSFSQRNFIIISILTVLLFFANLIFLSDRYDFILNTNIDKNMFYTVLLFFLLFFFLFPYITILINPALMFFLVILGIYSKNFIILFILAALVLLIFINFYFLARKFIRHPRRSYIFFSIAALPSIVFYLGLSFFNPAEYNAIYLTNSFLLDLKIAYLIDRPNYYFLFFHNVYSSLPDTICGFLWDPDIDKENIISCSYPNIQKRSVENILFHLLEAERDHHKPCKYLLRRACINIKNERLYLLTEEEFKERVFDP